MDSIPSQLLLQLILILVNAFFAATEIAVLSLNTTMLEKKAEEQDRTAIRLLKLTKEPAGFLSTIQIGITLAGFLGSAFAADNFSEYLVQWIYYDIGYHGLPLQTLDMLSVIVITLILSYFTLVLGELVPKRIAMQKPYEVAKISSGVVLLISKIVKPVVMFLSFSTNVVLKVLHLKTEAQEETISEEEILTMIELGKKRGVLDEEESERLQNIFDFDDTCIEDIMTHTIYVTSIDYQATKKEILSIIQESGLSRYPVYDHHEIIGILHSRDYLLNLQTHEKDFKDLLSQPYFVPNTMKADDLFEDMQQKHIHIAIVVNEYGEVVGLITMEDLIEEIFGNIYDEHDYHIEDSVQLIHDNQWKVRGYVTIEDFVDYTHLPIPESDEYDTIAGYVYSHLRMIPQDGSTKTIETDEFIFQITKVQNRSIKELIITKK